MKNRKREICTSGSVRDEDGQPPHLLGHRRQFLHIAAGAAALPAVLPLEVRPTSSHASSDNGYRSGSVSRTARSGHWVQ
jgi:hypothetical protein